MQLNLCTEDMLNAPYKTGGHYDTVNSPKNNARTRQINGQIFKMNTKVFLSCLVVSPFILCVMDSLLPCNYC
jgi:hypothetical protein